MKTVSLLDGRVVEKELWQTVRRTVGPLELSPECAHHLRGWIAMAIARMEQEGRLEPHDAALAEANLRRFIDGMKSEAVFLGHADRLDREAFQAAHRQLERKALLGPDSLWPFWPNEFWKV